MKRFRSTARKPAARTHALRRRLEALEDRVTPATMSRTKTSVVALVSPLTRFDAVEENATLRPSADTEGKKFSPFAGRPPVPVDTRRVTPACRSRMKTSRTPFVSPATRLDASEPKTTYRPSPRAKAS